MKPVTVALLGAALCAPLASAQLQPVQVQSGRVSLHILDGALDAFGLQMQDLHQTAQVGTPEEEFIAGDLIAFSIADDADLMVLRNRADEFFQAYGVLGGGLNVDGGFTLVSPSTGKSVDFDGFRLHAEDVRNDGPGGEPDPDYFFVSTAADPTAGDFVIYCVKILFSPDEGYVSETGETSAGHHAEQDKLRIKAWDLVISPVLADKLGRPDLAGQTLGYGKLDADTAVFEGDWQHPVGQNVFTPYQNGAGEPGGFEGSVLDVKLGLMSGITDQGHVGSYPNGRVGLSMSTTSCNVGDVNVTWLAAMNENHPGIAMQMYRQMGNRFEQVAVSWIKHGFFALSNSQCTACQNPSPGTFLGVGCSDTYGASNNGDRFWLGPRSEWNVYTSEWTCQGSYFDGTPVDCVRSQTGSGLNSVDHRLEGFDYDFDLPGASYFYEAMYMVKGDEFNKNNIGSREATLTWNGSSWNTSSAPGSFLLEGPAILRYGDDSTTADMSPDDGKVILAVDVVDLGNGTWRYEYALFNWTLDRKVRSFSVPTGGLASDFYFHDVDDQAANDWVVTTDGKNVTWTFNDVNLSGHKVAGALEFGTLYNFGFTSNKAPADRIASLGIHEAGPGGDLLGVEIQAPGTLAMSSTDLAPAEGETPSLILRGGTANALMAVIAVNGASIPPLLLTPSPIPFVGGEAALPLNIPVGTSGLTFDLLGAHFGTSVIELSNVAQIKIQ